MDPLQRHEGLENHVRHAPRSLNDQTANQPTNQPASQQINQPANQPTPRRTFRVPLYLGCLNLCETFDSFHVRYADSTSVDDLRTLLFFFITTFFSFFLYSTRVFTIITATVLGPFRPDVSRRYFAAVEWMYCLQPCVRNVHPPTIHRCQ